MFLNSSTPLAARSAAGVGRPPSDTVPGPPACAPPGVPGSEYPAGVAPLAVDRLPDGNWQLTLHSLEPVSVSRLAPDEVHIVLAPPPGAPHRPAAAPAPRATAPRPAPPAAGPVRIDTDTRTVHVDGRQLDLPRLEFDLLAHLVRHPGRAYTRSQLMAAVWPSRSAGDRTVDVHIARLRRRLGPRRRACLSTVFGVGYKYLPYP